MRKLLLIASPMLALAASPAFSQGALMSPPSPNAANSEPEPTNSTPPGSRTLPAGTTGMQREGTLSTTSYGTKHRHHHATRHTATPAASQARTVPTPQSE